MDTRLSSSCWSVTQSAEQASRRASQLCGVWRTPAGSPPKQPPSADTPCNAQYTWHSINRVCNAPNAVGVLSTQHIQHTVHSAHNALNTLGMHAPPCVLSFGAGIQLTKCCGAKYTAGKAFFRASWNRSDKAATTKLIMTNQMNHSWTFQFRKQIAGRTHQKVSW